MKTIKIILNNSNEKQTFIAGQTLEGENNDDVGDKWSDVRTSRHYRVELKDTHDDQK
jgi:hypothetical protein